MAPVAMAWSSGMTSVSTPVFCRICSFISRSTSSISALVHGGVMREIEAQARRFHHAARLLDVRAQHLAQRGVQQVRGGMIARAWQSRSGAATSARSSSPTRIGARASRCDARSGRARREKRSPRRPPFRRSSANRARRDRPPGRRFRRRTASGRGPVRHPRPRRLRRTSSLIHQQPDHARSGFQFVVSQELRAALLQQLLIGRSDRALFRALPTGARALALLLHLAIEAFAVDRRGRARAPCLPARRAPGRRCRRA